MPNFTPEVRNGKPSRLTTGLLDNSISFAKKTLLGLGMLAMVGCGTASSQRTTAVAGSLGYDALSTGVSGLVGYGLNEMLSPPNYNSTNNQRDAIRQHTIFRLKVKQLSDLTDQGIITKEQYGVLIEKLMEDYDSGKL